jgi:chromosome segregation ATPase
LTEEGELKDGSFRLQIETQRKEIESLKADLAISNSEKSSLLGQISTLTQKLQTQSQIHSSDLEALKLAHSSELALKDSKISDLNQELRLLGQKISYSTKEGTSIEHQLNSAKSQLASMTKEAETLTERLRILSKELEESKILLDQKQQLIHQIKLDYEQQIEELKEKHRVAAEGYEEKVGQMKAEMDRWSEGIGKGEGLVKQLEYEITMLKKGHLEEMEKMKKAVEREVRAKMAVENKYRDEISSNKSQIKILEKEIEGKIEEIDKLARENKRIRDVGDLYKKDIENQKETIKGLTQSNADLSKSLAEVQNELERLKEKFSNIPDVDFEDIKLKEKIAQMKEKRIKSLLSKINSVMSSMESNLCCYLCMEVFNDAISLTPCGHNFCHKCFKEHKPSKCPKCDSKISTTTQDDIINDVSTKYLFERDILAAFQNDDIWKNMAEDEK